MPVQVVVVVVAVAVVLLIGVCDIHEADLVPILALVIHANVTGSSIVHTPAVQCRLDEDMSVTGTIPVLLDA